MTAMRRTPPLTLRRLTPGERALAAEVFGQALDTGRVRLFVLPLWSRAFVPNGRLVVWPAAAAAEDFAQAPLFLQSQLIHELVHVWQAQTGVNLLAAKLKAGDGEASYAYDLADGRPFHALNIEQQAMVVQHRFMAERGGAAPYPAATYSRFLGAWPAAAAAKPHAN